MSSYRLMIGLEDAEERALREFQSGLPTSPIDPNCHPSEYHWKVHGDDFLCVAVDPVSKEYAQLLGRTLMNAGARSVAVVSGEETLYVNSVEGLST